MFKGLLHAFFLLFKLYMQVCDILNVIVYIIVEHFYLRLLRQNAIYVTYDKSSDL